MEKKLKQLHGNKVTASNNLWTAIKESSLKYMYTVYVSPNLTRLEYC